jgi:hypothetical protein
LVGVECEEFSVSPASENDVIVAAAAVVWSERPIATAKRAGKED